MPEEKLPDNVLWHQSGVSHSNNEPFVQLLLGGKIIAQMTPEEARDHAKAITEAAEASEQDAFLIDFARKRMCLPRDKATAFLMDFRQYRAERTGKRGGPSRPTDWVMPTTS